MQKPDRFTKTLLALLVLGVWGLLLRPLVPVTPAEAQANGRPRWEYLSPSGDEGSYTNWNKLGREGWELVAVTNNRGYGIFKRRLP